MFIWFAGLRGATAFVLALDVPTQSHTPILTTTLMIVMFTVILQGATTTSVLKFLKIPIGIQDEDTLILEPGESNFFINLDRNYFIPLFTIKHPDSIYKIVKPDTDPQELSELLNNNP
jgi:hypothetical protein